MRARISDSRGRRIARKRDLSEEKKNDAACRSPEWHNRTDDREEDHEARVRTHTQREEAAPGSRVRPRGSND